MFLKKPIPIEARQFTKETAKEVSEWCHARIGTKQDGTADNLMITTLEGIMVARLGDWIIKGVRGEFYPCAENIFYETYEKVE